MIHIYDLKGRPAWSHSETVAGNLKPEHLDASRRNGISIVKQLAVPPGLYQIRLGVQEDSTGKIGTASCWVEVPDLAQKRMAMSTVVLGADAGELRRNGPDSPDESPRIHTIKFFDKGDKLVYAFMLYHSPRDSNGASPLEMQLEIVRGSQPIAETGWSPVASHQVSEDKLGILVAGELPLSDMKTGVYDLRVAIRDPKSKRSLQNSVQFGIN